MQPLKEGLRCTMSNALVLISWSSGRFTSVVIPTTGELTQLISFPIISFSIDMHNLCPIVYVLVVKLQERFSAKFTTQLLEKKKEEYLKDHVLFFSKIAFFSPSCECDLVIICEWDRPLLRTHTHQSACPAAVSLLFTSDVTGSSFQPWSQQEAAEDGFKRACWKWRIEWLQKVGEWLWCRVSFETER